MAVTRGYDMKGLSEMLGKLSRMVTSADRKAGRAGVNAGLAVLAKAQRQAVGAAAASPEMRRAAKQAIGKRLTARDGQPIGKAGFGVGKQTKIKLAKAAARAGDKTRRGVGMSARNIHWAVLGTVERQTGAIKGNASRALGLGRGWRGRFMRAAGGVHKTGRMPAVLVGILQRATEAAGPAAIEAAGNKTWHVIVAEAIKK